jgi:putative NADH-flavin reductase
MQIFIIGGSGRTGQEVIQQCLDRDHKITALVRSKGSLAERPGLTIVEGMFLEPNTPNIFIILINFRNAS